MELKGTRAIVTGGASGLGGATARHFAASGARVAILDFNAGAAESLAAEIGAVAVQADVSDADEVAAAFDAAVTALDGAPRIAVNCAGIAAGARIVGRDGDLSLDVFQRTIAVNLLGTYHVMSHAARAMMAMEPTAGGERGVIINTASVAWQDGQIGQSAYAASKGAIAAMCLPAARELARAGIRVMAIAPGLFDTPMMQGLPQEVSDGIIANIPCPPRLGDPAEFARLAADIVANPYLNGTTIRLDAAVRLPPR